MSEIAGASSHSVGLYLLPFGFVAGYITVKYLAHLLEDVPISMEEFHPAKEKKQKRE